MDSKTNTQQYREIKLHMKIHQTRYMSTALVSDKFVNINYSTVLIQIANSYTVFIMPVIMHNAGIQLTVQ